MTPRRREDRAWDSDALIGWIGQESDKQADCEPVIRACERGEVRLVVSALAQAEVLKLGRGHDRVPRSAQERIDRFFANPYIVTRNVDPATSRLARELHWDHNIDPKDAVHVATALRAPGVTVLESFDGGLLRHGRLEVPGFDPLTIRRPLIENDQQVLIPPDG